MNRRQLVVLADETLAKMGVETVEGASDEERLRAADSATLLIHACNKCKKPGNPETTCPYSSEIHNETVECGCCEDCRHECAMDI